MKTKLVSISLAILLIIFLGYFLLKKDGPAVPALRALSIGSFVNSSDESQSKYKHTYESKKYNFSLAFDEELTVKGFDEGGGAATIVFENTKDAHGLQIFVVPYGESKISQERFLRDVPSGVRREEYNLSIDGVQATAFYSENLTLGETWEVWVIYKGFLYEITTPKALKPWLENIIKGWKWETGI